MAKGFLRGAEIFQSTVCPIVFNNARQIFPECEKFCRRGFVSLRPPGYGPGDECDLLPCFNAKPDIFAVMNCCVVALGVFSSDILTWRADNLQYKGFALRRICILYQETSPKRWFGNINMKSKCDVTTAHKNANDHYMPLDETLP